MIEANDENEIIKLSCSSPDCDKSIEGTWEELFGDLRSLVGLPEMKCKCGGDICLDLTGRYKECDVET